MELENILIENFRGIKKTEIEGFSKVNFFIGKNNSCKTSILESIFLAVGAGNPALNVRINNFRNLMHIEEDDFELIFYQLNYNNRPKFTSKFNKNGYTRTLEIIPNKSLKSNLNSNSQNIDETNNLDYGTNSSSKSINGLELKFSNKERHKRKETYSSKIIFENSDFRQINIKDYEETLSGSYIPSTGQTMNVSSRLEKIIVNKNHKTIIEILKKIDPKIEDISLGARGMIYLDIGIEKLIPLNLAGDGVRKMLVILVSIIHKENGIVLIDEIDNGLHYLSQTIFLKAMFDLAHLYNVQIFATTHNYETLTKLKMLLEEDSMELYRSKMKTYALRKNSENIITSYAYDFDKLNHVIEQAIEIR